MGRVTWAYPGTSGRSRCRVSAQKVLGLNPVVWEDKRTVLCPPMGNGESGTMSRQLCLDSFSMTVFFPVCGCVCACVCLQNAKMQVFIGTRGIQIPLRLKLQTIVGAGTQTRSSGRTVCAFNHEITFWSLTVLLLLHVTVWSQGRPSVPRS